MKRLKILRIVLAVLSLMAVVVLTAIGQSNAVARYLPVASACALSLGACLLWLGVTLLVGRVYCSAICPLGTLQDCAAWLEKRLHRHGRGHYRFKPGQWRLRLLILLLVAAGVVSDEPVSTHLTDPVTLTTTIVQAHSLWHVLPWGLAGVAGAVVVTLAVMWMAWRDGRTFCNTVCPVGTVMAAAAQVSVWQLEIDPDLCISCGKCTAECKAHCVNSFEHTIDNARCVMCLNCAASCPNRAIRFTMTRKKLSTPLMQRTTRLSET